MALLVAVVMAAILIVGVIVFADEMDWGINVALVGGGVLVAIGLVGLCAVVWNSVRRLMD
jgi:hypothetical protein